MDKNATESSQRGPVILWASGQGTNNAICGGPRKTLGVILLAAMHLGLVWFGFLRPGVSLVWACLFGWAD